ncbi:MAG TPA: hypothetical protein DDW52_13275 [Planctomycetaceae bacterium]|nr:hypothetical protein [Planctomycetaceae bacterium]
MKRVKQSDRLSLAIALAPEDVEVGDYIAPLYRTYEVPSYMWDDSFGPEVVRMQFIAPESGKPLKVKSICLPFVHVKSGKKQSTIIDLRTTQIVRLDRAFAKSVVKDVKKKRFKTI